MLRYFLRIHECCEEADNSFAGISKEDILTHCRIRRYGNFVLTGAISPSYSLKVKPEQGYKYERCNEDVVMVVYASQGIVFNLFMDLANVLGRKVDAFLETSHHLEGSNLLGQKDFCSHRSDKPILLSALWDYEDLLTNDGCTGIAIKDRRQKVEINLDEHKLIAIYEYLALQPELLAVLRRYGVDNRPGMELISEVEHIHISSNRFRKQFRELRRYIGAIPVTEI